MLSDLRSARRTGSALALALLVGAGLSFLFLRSVVPHHTTQATQFVGPSSMLGLGWRPSVAQPLPPGAQQVQLADASSLLGGSLALPNSNLVTGSDAGPVWANALHDPESGFTQNTIAVTFPSQGVIVEYQRPASFSDPAAHYKGEAGQQPGSQLLNLNGVTGLGIDQNVDGQGNFGVVDFVSGGTRVVVLGHYNQSTLQQIALSIVNQPSPSSP